MSGNACSWTSSQVTLIDGTVVLCDSEEWRHECEARYILDMPNKPLRVAFLENIEKGRGLGARQALEAKILELWRARQPVAAAQAASA